MIKYQNFVDFSSKVNNKNEYMRDYSVEFKRSGINQKVDILPPSKSRQQKMAKIKEEEERKAFRKNKIKKAKMKRVYFRRRVGALSLSAIMAFCITVGVKKHDVKEANKDLVQAFALENDEEFRENQYLEDQNNVVEEDSKQNVFVPGQNDSRYEDTVYKGERIPYKSNKYGKMTEESSNMIRAINVKEDIKPSNNNKITVLKNAGKLTTTIGERINVYVDQNGENFLNMNLRTKSGLTAEQIDKALAGTGLEGLGKDYIKAEEDNNINAMFLVGLSCLESNYGSSNFAKTRNNITGFRAYTEDPSKAIYYNTKGECIYKTAEYLSNNYMEEGSKYYNGSSMVGLNIKYCTSPTWAIKINNIMLKLFNNFS